MIVWLAALRRKGQQSFHYRPDGDRKTACGRFIGDPNLPPERGYLVTREEAVDTYGAKECGQCSGASYGESRPKIGQR